MSFETEESVVAELKMFTENDGDIYRSQTTSILKNLATKKAQGKYDHDKAVQAFMYLAEAGARKDGNYDYASEIGAQRFWEEAPDHDIDVPDDVQTALDVGDDPRDPTNTELDAFAEDMTNDQLKDPMDYLRNIYGGDATKEAIRIAGIDIDAAAEDAVDTDGPEHFVGHYDGKSHETRSGFVYWRTY